MGLSRASFLSQRRQDASEVEEEAHAKAEAEEEKDEGEVEVGALPHCQPCHWPVLGLGQRLTSTQSSAAALLQTTALAPSLRPPVWCLSTPWAGSLQELRPARLSNPPSRSVGPS